MNRQMLVRRAVLLSFASFATLAIAGQPSAASAGKGTIVTFDPPGALDTYPWSANADGSIVGFWYDPTDNTTKSFIRAPDGSFTTFDHADSKVTAAYSINKTGIATGYYTVDEGNHPAFIRQIDGTLDIFHAPGDDSGTFPIAITSKGAIAGSFYDL